MAWPHPFLSTTGFSLDADFVTPVPVEIFCMHRTDKFEYFVVIC